MKWKSRHDLISIKWSMRYLETLMILRFYKKCVMRWRNQFIQMIKKKMINLMEYKNNKVKHSK